MYFLLNLKKSRKLQRPTFDNIHHEPQYFFMKNDSDTNWFSLFKSFSIWFFFHNSQHHLLQIFFMTKTLIHKNPSFSSSRSSKCFVLKILVYVTWIFIMSGRTISKSCNDSSTYNDAWYLCDYPTNIQIHFKKKVLKKKKKVVLMKKTYIFWYNWTTFSNFSMAHKTIPRGGFLLKTSGPDFFPVKNV